jgi:hypothetical protein
LTPEFFWVVLLEVGAQQVGIRRSLTFAIGKKPALPTLAFRFNDLNRTLYSLRILSNCTYGSTAFLLPISSAMFRLLMMEGKFSFRSDNFADSLRLQVW